MKTDSNTTRTEIEFSNVQPIWRFCFLYIITVGLYSIAWHHKQWTFIRNRGNLAIPPGAWIRGIFSGFFIYLLCRRISALAEDRGYEKKLSAFGLTALVWFLGSLANLPDPFRLLTVLIVIPHIPILKAVNYYWEQEKNAQQISNFLESYGFTPIVRDYPTAPLYNIIFVKNSEIENLTEMIDDFWFKFTQIKPGFIELKDPRIMLSKIKKIVFLMMPKTLHQRVHRFFVLFGSKSSKM